MPVTYQEFAAYLMKNGVYEYRNNQTVHCYATKEGRVRFFANWGGYETRDYSSLQALIAETCDLPPAARLRNIPPILNCHRVAMLDALEDVVNLFGSQCDHEAVLKARAVIEIVTNATAKQGA